MSITPEERTAMRRLMDIACDIPKDTLIEVLRSCAGDVDAAEAVLLGMLCTNDRAPSNEKLSADPVAVQPSCAPPVNNEFNAIPLPPRPRFDVPLPSQEVKCEVVMPCKDDSGMVIHHSVDYDVVDDASSDELSSSSSASEPCFFTAEPVALPTEYVIPIVYDAPVAAAPRVSKTVPIVRISVMHGGVTASGGWINEGIHQVVLHADDDVPTSELKCTEPRYVSIDLSKISDEAFEEKCETMFREEMFAAPREKDERPVDEGAQAYIEALVRDDPAQRAARIEQERNDAVLAEMLMAEEIQKMEEAEKRDKAESEQQEKQKQPWKAQPERQPQRSTRPEETANAPAEVRNSGRGHGKVKTHGKPFKANQQPQVGRVKKKPAAKPSEPTSSRCNNEKDFSISEV